ncbi:MAG: alpha/beta hydrolase [Cyclobacteriaceae bacterium]|nr:alpha/beta hydrolase [Cyclobacteriaceae bacterium]
MHAELYLQAEKKLFHYYNLTGVSSNIYIPAIGSQVRIIECGHGEPLLFVAGDTSSGSTWVSLAALLPDFRCILLDRPGTGLSEDPDYSKMPFRKFASETIDGVVNHLGIPKINIIGNSLGGYFTLAYAYYHGEKVNKIILDGMPGSVPGMKFNLFAKLMSYSWFNKMVLKNMKLNKEEVIKNFKRMGHDKSIKQNLFPEIMWEYSLQMAIHTNGFKNDWGQYSIIKSHKGEDSKIEFSWNELKQIKNELCILWGEDDTFCKPEMFDNLVKQLNPKFSKLFPDSGHLTFLENTQEHADSIRKFIYT